MRRTSLLITGLSILLLGTTQSEAANIGVVTLDFEGLEDTQPIGDFYNGGSFTRADSTMVTGPDYNVVFEDALALRSEFLDPFNGTGTFTNDNFIDDSVTVLFFTEGPALLRLVEDTFFTTGFSFFYSAQFGATVDVFASDDGTGTPLVSESLGANWQTGCENMLGSYCNWELAQLALAPGDEARSIVFGGDARFVGFDNITFGSLNPVPLPPAIWLLASALLGFAALRRRRS